MSTVGKRQWGVTSDNDAKLESKAGGKFGLNVGNITKFEFNPNGGKNGAESPAIDLTVTCDGREYRTRVFDVPQMIRRGKKELNPGDEGYDKAFDEEQAQREAFVLHVVKALGVTEAQVNNALAGGNIVDFSSWAEVMTNCKPSDFSTKSVDVFLQWQNSIREGEDKTYLELPRNMKSGRFLSPSIAAAGGTWKEITDEQGIRYTDANGQEHPIFKSAAFLTKNAAKQQVEGAGDSSNPLMSGVTPGSITPGGTPTPSSWGQR